MSTRPDQAEAAAPVRTTCPYCGVGCGVLVGRDAQGQVVVRGDPEHPANFGRLCAKGSALGETLDLEGRLLHPQLDGERVDWDRALDAVGARLRRVIERDGPDAVAFYVSGQLLTEDYYVANKLMKGFIGSANIDTNSRLCMSSAVAAHKRAFGSDTVPVDYTDLEQADLVVLVGSNLAWCHPVLYQRLLQARRQRPSLRIVVVDPRRTATCEAADLHLPIRSATDGYLFNGLLTWLAEDACLDQRFIERHTEGLAAALQAARWHAPSVRAVAEHCGLAPVDVERFYRLFATTENTVTLFSQGINQSSSGTDKGNAIINCHLATGRLGRPGMGPFSITGQPNAMGGREVGGLANQLAAHMDLDNARHRALVQGFWRAPRLAARPGLKAVDLFEAIARGRVKALWVMATNPAVSLPHSGRVRDALQRLDCLVVSDCVAANDTMAYAHVRLPALTWGEKDGTVTNSERRISRQRAFLPPPGEARPDWWMVCEVAKRLGHAGFDYPGPAAIFDEHARLSALHNAGGRDFDLSALSGLPARRYAALEPVQWPCRAGEGRAGRLFADGRFYTEDGRARFVAIDPRPPRQAVGPAYPLVLNSGRVRDHWHTMTRTAKSARLSAHTREPRIAVHPADAAALRLTDGGLAEVASAGGEALLRVELSESLPCGQVFAPMHWSDQFAARARIGSLIGAATDPVSGQPEFKHTPVRLRPYAAAWYGFLLTRGEVQPRHAAYWSKSRRDGLWQYELAGDRLPADWAVEARTLLCDDGGAEWRELSDSGQAHYRGARLVDGRLDAVLVIQPGIDLPPRDWLAGLFGEASLDAQERACLLRGTPPGGRPDPGPTVCACFGVGLNTLVSAIREQGLDTPEALGEVLKAGTNCGSCVPELRRLIGEARLAESA